MVVSTAPSKVKALFLRGKELSGSDIENLNILLHRLKVQELKMLAKEVHVQLTGSFRKDNFIKRIVGMARIGALQPKSDVRFDDIGTISYLTEDIKCDLCSLPSFTSVTEWGKKLAGVLINFTFMNLLLYLVYGRDKTFDMQSLKAYKSLKTYKFFMMGL